MRHIESIKAIESSLQNVNELKAYDLVKHKEQFNKDNDLIKYLTQANNTKGKDSNKNFVKELSQSVNAKEKDIKKIDGLLVDLEFILKDICDNTELKSKCKNKEKTGGNENKSEEELEFVEKLIEKIVAIDEYDKTVHDDIDKYEKDLITILQKPDEYISEANKSITIDKYENGKSRILKLDDSGDGSKLKELLKQIKETYNKDFANFKNNRNKDATDLKNDITKLIGIVKDKSSILGKPLVKSLEQQLKDKSKTKLKEIENTLNEDEKKSKNMIKYLERFVSAFETKLGKLYEIEKQQLQQNNRDRYNRSTNLLSVENQRRNELLNRVEKLLAESNQISVEAKRKALQTEITNLKAKINGITITTKDTLEANKKAIDESQVQLEKLENDFNLLKRAQEQDAENKRKEEEKNKNNVGNVGDVEAKATDNELKDVVTKIQNMLKRMNNGNMGFVSSKTRDLANMGDDIFKMLLDDYEEKRNSALNLDDKINVDTEFLKKVDAYGLNFLEIFKPNDSDKLFFVMLILVVQLIAFSILEILIENDWVDNLLSSVITYGVIYTAIMTGIIFAVNTLGYKLKLMFNYLNTDFNISQIIVHFSIIAVFLIIIGIVSMKVKTYVVEDKNYEEKIKLLYRIDMISTIITIFTALFVFLL